MTNQDGPVLTPSMLPNAADFDVKGSSFFHKWPELPSPGDVRSKAESQYLAGVNHDTRRNPRLTPPFVRPPLVVFEDMGLLVKWGSGVSLNEGLALYAIRLLLEGSVPVPEVYGWRTEGSERYIYMEYMHGQTLEHGWEGIDPDNRDSICAELQSIIKNLRQLKQDPLDPFVGSITRGSLYDRALHPSYMSEAGPFTTIREFHDWFTFLCRRPMPDPYSVPIEPFRYELPDDCAIKFTHGDLHRSNIIISAQEPYGILAIVDWEQAGWLPEYWEARKALYSVYGSEWAMTYLPLVMELYSDTWEAWDWYTTSMGC